MALLAPLRICDAAGAEVPATRYDRLPDDRCHLLRPSAPLSLFSQVWAEARYLVFDVAYSAEHHSDLQLRFWARGSGDGKTEDEPRLVAHCAFVPDLPARLAFDFKLLDGHCVQPSRTPGRLKTVIEGRRIDPRELARIEVLLADHGSKQWCFITVPRLHTDMPFCKVPKKTLVDELGQLAGRSWPGRVSDEETLRAALTTERDRPAPAPRVDRSHYGGCLQRYFEASGRFRLHRDGGTWWLVDPDGFGFFSSGVGLVRDAEPAAIVPGTEELYAWLPRKDSAFADCLGEHAASSMPTVAFARANLKRAFGAQHAATWTALTSRRLRDWGFNTLGPGSDPGLVQSLRLPWTFAMARFPGTPLRLYRDLADVFDPAYSSQAKEWAAQLASLADDPLLLGYSMGAEPAWADGGANLASEMLETHPGSHSRRAFARFVAARYTDDVAAWTRTWGLAVEGFADLEARCFHRLADSHPGAVADLWDFSKLLARRWAEIPVRECRKAAPQLLNLGCVFAADANELCAEAAREFDLVSLALDTHLPDPDIIAQIVARCGKPVLLADHAVGSRDRGQLATGRLAATNQPQRAAAVRACWELAASLPGVVGCHWAQWNDQPALGRHDGECAQTGLVDVCQQPYPELAAAFSLAHDRLYQLRLGSVPPVAERIERSPAIH